MINYVIGDATSPKGKGSKYIVHICNNFGAWGAGFVMALSAKWPQPEKKYREWYNSGKGFGLGNIQLVEVEEDLVVVNMVAQGSRVNYDALKTCLRKVAHSIPVMGKSTIHMPRIGCGIGGGTWEEVEEIVSSCLRGYEVFVYDLPKGGK